MKKKALLLVMGLSIMLMAGGCVKKNVADELSGNNSSANDNTTAVTGAPVTGAPVTGAPSESAPVKEAYKASDFVTLGNYKGVKVSVEKLEVTDEDIDSAIQSDLEANATQEEVTDRAVQNGDIVNIDFEGLKGGVAFDGGTATGQDLTIGSGTFIPGFEDGIIGHNKGEKFDVNVTFPEDYANSPDLAGQAVVFKVTLNSIKKSIVPELTEDYVKNSTDYDSIQAYRDATREKLQADNDKQTESNKSAAVLQTIVEASKVSSIPQNLLDYYKYLINSNYTQMIYSYYGTTVEEFIKASGKTQEDFDNQILDYATKSATSEMVERAIAEKEGISISDADYKELLPDFLTDYGYSSEDQLLQYVSKDEVKDEMLLQKALKVAIDQAVVTYTDAAAAASVTPVITPAGTEVGK